MNGDRSEYTELNRLLASLRDAESATEVSPHVEDVLLQAWDHAHATSRISLRATGFGSRRSRAVTGWLSAAAAVAITVGLTTLGERLRMESAPPTGVEVNEPGAVVFVGAPILDNEPVRVVRMRMPASVLHDLGVRSTSGNLDAIDVDVIVGEDGVARALRVGTSAAATAKESAP